MRSAGMAAVVLSLLSGAVRAQFTPAPNAVKLPDSLVFTSTTANNHATLVWHPVKARYYSLRIGNSTFPLETWVAGSSTSVCTATAGIDSRGIWYNPATNAIERNCFGTLGWATLDIDAAACATGAFTTIFSGQLQATDQSVAAFDPVLNQVLTYAAATTSVQFRSRATGAVVQTLLLTGTSFTNVNTESIIWTGQAGYEIGLLNYVTKRVLLFSRATGAFTGQSQLPAAAATNGQFRFCYTNNRVWLFNGLLRKWNAYCIWNQSCPMVLPVELVAMDAHCTQGRASLAWSTATERNSSHFFIERSTDLDEWSVVGRVEAAGNSQQTVHYAWSEPHVQPGDAVYYRLHQVDLDGRSEVFPAVPLLPCEQGPGTIRFLPNPVGEDGACELLLPIPPSAGASVQVFDPSGRLIQRSPLSPDGGPGRIRLDLKGTEPGVYLVAVLDAAGGQQATGRLIRH